MCPALSAVEWVTDNPGGQLLTGSFHPVRDEDWADRHSWDRRWAPTGAGLANLFARRHVYRFRAMLRQAHAMLVPRLPSPSLCGYLLRFCCHADVSCLSTVKRYNPPQGWPAVRPPPQPVGALPILQPLSRAPFLGSVQISRLAGWRSGIDIDWLSAPMDALLQSVAGGSALSPRFSVGARRIVQGLFDHTLSRIVQQMFRERRKGWDQRGTDEKHLISCLSLLLPPDLLVIVQHSISRAEQCLAQFVANQPSNFTRQTRVPPTRRKTRQLPSCGVDPTSQALGLHISTRLVMQCTEHFMRNFLGEFGR